MLMRVFSCNLCLPSSCCFKSIRSPPVSQLGDEGIPSIDGDALEKKPSVGDCEVKEKVPQVDNSVLDRGLVGGQGEEALGGDVEGVVVLKSSLKKPRQAGMGEVRKGRVKWMDILGKDLVDVQEFEASESEDSEGDCGDRSCCACVIQ